MTVPTVRALYDSYYLCVIVISSMQQLPLLSDSCQIYATVTSPIQQFSSVRQLSPMQQFWLYETVISPIRQLLPLYDSYQLYATVITPI